MNDLKFTTASDYMNTDAKFDDLMYRAGLTAQGSWDEMDDYDRTAIQKFAELIVQECAKVADIADENKCEWIGGNILTHFGVEEE